MPYIDKHERDLIDHSADFTGMSGLNQFIKKVDKLKDSVCHSHMAKHPGTLNYIITRLCDYWCRDFAGEANYEKYNAVDDTAVRRRDDIVECSIYEKALLNVLAPN